MHLGLGWSPARAGLALAVFITLVVYGPLANGGYHKVEPEVGEWSEGFCSAANIYVGVFCEAKGGVWDGNAYGGDCIGANQAEWDALPVQEKVRRIDFHRHNMCDMPDVTFSGWSEPAHNQSLCWDTVTASRYGVENWSTSNLQTSGLKGDQCDTPVGSPYSGLRTRDVTCPEGSSARDEGEGQFCYKWCPDDQILVNGQCENPPDKDEGCDGDNMTSKPCNVATGNKYRSETDITSGPLRFTRHYNSLYLADNGLGPGWRHSYQQELIILSPDSLVLVGADGRGEPWERINGVWQGDADTLVSVTDTPTGFEVTLPNGVVDAFNDAGQWLSQTDPNGVQLTLAYNAEQQLTQVNDHYGHSLMFGYNGEALVSVTDAEGAVITYDLDSDGNLSTVTFPGTTHTPAKTYHYDNATYPHHLTGITDENGDRYATFAYQADGKVNTSELAITASPSVGQQHVTLAFQPDPDPNDDLTSTVLSDAIGTEELWEFQRILGSNKLIAKINQTDNKGLTQTWDANGNRLTRTDAEGRVTRYTYNATNQKTSMTEADGTPEARTTTYEYVYPDIDLVTKVISPSIYGNNNKEVITAHDGNLNVTGITVNGFTAQGQAVSRSITFQHDAYGKVTQIDGARTDVADITTLKYYDCNTGVECGQLEKVTNAAGHITTYDLYDAAARLTQMTDPNGVVTTYTYHPRGWLLSSTQTPPAGSARVTTYQYDDVGQLTKITLPDGSEQNYVYDAAHDLREIYDNLGNKVEYTYDAKGNRIKERVTDPDGTLVRSTTTAYDMRNFVESINTAGSITTLVNNAVGNLDSQTDPNNNPSTSHHFDPLDRLTQTIDALTNNTDYDYNVADQLIEVTAPNGAITQYEYDDLGNQTKEISADRGTLTYTHDEAGNVVSMTDARGITTSYAYDVLNRLISITYPTASENVTFTYDQGANCGSALGRLCQVDDATGAHQYRFDAWGNITRHLWQSAFADITVVYQYDAMNRPISVTYPSGQRVSYERDAIGRVTGVYLPGELDQEIIADQFTYRADGVITGYRLGNGQQIQQSVDLQGRLTQQTSNDQLLISQSYDANGNVVTTTQPDQQRAFTYDPLDRLTNDDWQSGSTQLADWVFNYDENGNRLSQQEDAQQSTLSYTPNSNRLTQIANDSVTMDAAGNITSLPRDTGTLTLFYNQQNHLSGMTRNGVSTSYTTNHQRQRLIKQHNGKTSLYVYDLNGRLISTVDEVGDAYEEYLYANGSDYNPIQYRVYQDTEADTVEADYAYQQSLENLTNPEDNPSGQCQDKTVTRQERNQTNALFTDYPNSGGGGGSPHPASAWLPPILFWLLDDGTSNGGGTDPDPNLEVSVDSQDTITQPSVTLTWPSSPNATEYVIEVATSDTALNNGPDIARVCAQTNTSALIDHIPLNGTEIHIRIWSKVNGQWEYEDYVLNTSGDEDPTVQVERTYLVNDHLNTPRFGYDDEGTQTWRWASEGFGSETPDSDLDSNGIHVNLNVRFPGMYHDQESGLYYNWNRYYIPETGGYTSSDPIGLAGGLNSFTYVGGNPLYWIDPTGLRGTAGGITTGTSSSYPRLSEGQQTPTFDGQGGQVYAGQRGQWDRGIFYPYMGEIYNPLTALQPTPLDLDPFPSSQPIVMGPGGAKQAGPQQCFPDDDCDKEWRAARRICRALIMEQMEQRAGRRKKRSVTGVTGGYTDVESCAAGLVSERCGGTKRDYGRKKPKFRMKF